jgi:hypothetical protein
MEKLQMASHAIGDIEALLEASGMDSDDDGTESFDEQLRKLVIAALAGKDVAAATQKAVESIENAKKTLETESATIDETLGRMDGAEYVGIGLLGGNGSPAARRLVFDRAEWQSTSYQV